MDFSVQVGGYSLGRPRSVPRTESIGTDVQVGETQSTEGATTTGSLTANAPEILLFQRKRGYVLSATMGLHVGKFKGITLRSVFLVIEPSILAYRYFWKPILQKKNCKILSLHLFFLKGRTNFTWWFLLAGWAQRTIFTDALCRALMGKCWLPSAWWRKVFSADFCGSQKKVA